MSELLCNDFTKPRRDSAGERDRDTQRLVEMFEAVADDAVLPIEP